MMAVRDLPGDLRAEARSGDPAADDQDVEIAAFVQRGYGLESPAV